jgi:hypothetical protein
MASQVSPGILIKERDLTNAVVTGALAIRAAHASSFAKGPIGDIVNINSQKELVAVFGEPSADNAEDWMVASEFLNYGGRLAVVRAQTSGVKNATTSTGSGLLIKSDSDWEAGVGSGEVFAARTAGSWGNSLMAVLVDRGADYRVTFAATPTDTAVGTSLTFTYSGDTVGGEILSYDASTDTATITTAAAITSQYVLAAPEQGLISTFTTDAAAEVGRTPGTYSGVAAAGGTGDGATFDVVVADAGVEAGGAANGQGGSVTVTLASAGEGYNTTETLTLAGGSIGGGSTITVTVTGIVDGSIAITALEDWYLNTEIGTTGIKLGDIAPRPGTSQYASDNGILHDQVHFAVVDTTGELTGTANTIVERITYLSKITDARSEENSNIYFKDVINAQSSYLYHGDSATVQVAVSGEAWGQATADVVGLSFSRTTGYWKSLDGGVDDYAYTSGQFAAAMDLFLDTEETEIDFVLMGGSMSLEVDTKAKATKVISIAAGRKDAIAFVSPHKGNQVGEGGDALTSTQQKEKTLAFFSGLTSTSYAVFDSGYKYVYDRFNDKYRWIPCNGDVAGLCVQTSNVQEDWYSPAGLNRGGILNAVKMAYNPNKADRDELYQNRINPIVSLRGQGITLFGDKTALSAPSAFDRINVRRLFLNLEKRARRLAEGVLFEQNDATTRAGFSSALNSYLSEVQARRGVTDYLVVCDESNNTPDVIDRNEFVAEVYVKPTRSINFITVTFTATKTGVTFSEVVGR